MRALALPSLPWLRVTARPATRAAGLAVTLGLSLAACTQEVTGDNLCLDPSTACADVPAICDPGSSDTGAVVVRWRVADVALGRLLVRGQCCCNPDPQPVGLAAMQCNLQGNDCLASPAWLVRNVQLRVSRADTPAQTCTFTARCADGELTTPACLKAGEYDLQLVADVEGFPVPASGGMPDTSEFRCLQQPARTPPAVRRRVRPGQTVNLDGIVLGVNAPR
ncbi:MAG: hypothetical protein U1A78_03490 [Polyangia bacterium]